MKPRVAAGQVPVSSTKPSLQHQVAVQLRAKGIDVRDSLTATVAECLGDDRDVQAVGLLNAVDPASGGVAGESVLMVLTEWNVAFGPLADAVLRGWPQREWRREQVLVIPRELIRQGSLADGQVRLVVAIPRGPVSATQTIGLPLVARTTNIALTLDWVALQATLAMAGSAAPQQGSWAPDPTGVARLRWWDGSTWTSHTRS